MSDEGAFAEDSTTADQLEGALLEAELDATDEYLEQVRNLLSDGFAGVIFTGPPGTSKSWYANQIAIHLADGDPFRLRFLQFHSSYQYEDFVEGFVPTEFGFELRPKHLIQMIDRARANPDKQHVIVIDELSRGDPSRIFGDTLTYIETSKRGLKFNLASGTEVAIPRNLVFLATMNPHDRGVDEVDVAFERRFAKIAMLPSRPKLEEFLAKNGMDDALVKRVGDFFTWLQRNQNEDAHIGHAYFFNVSSESDLKRLWNHQLSFVLDRAFRLDRSGFESVTRQWGIVLPVVAPAQDEGNPAPQSDAGEQVAGDEIPVTQGPPGT
jgi:5-methylcytosine-specific restriction protein B